MHSYHSTAQLHLNLGLQEMASLMVAAPSPEHFPLRWLVPPTPSAMVQLAACQLKLNLCRWKEKGEGKEES